MREPLRIGSTRHPRVLQIDARAWVARQSTTAGRRVGLANIPADEIASIAELGFDLVWLTAAWTIGSGSRRLWRASPWMCERRAALLPDGSDDDIVGSPYAVAAYEPAENLGGEAGLASLRTRLAQAGVGLILDFYPNQTATDHPWVRRHPDRYVHADASHRDAEPDGSFEVRSDGRHWIAHGRDPNFPPMTDTAQLEYRHPEVRRAMMQTLRDIATRCDGVVCSMAMLVLDDVFRATWATRSVTPDVGDDPSHAGEFWWHAASAVRQAYPNFLLIAQAYWGLEWRLQQLGFDYTYDKPLLDRLIAGDPGEIAGHLRADDTYQRRSVRFLEDRSEPRVTTRMTPHQERAAALTAATVPGMLLIDDGQMAGARLRAPVQLRREPDETPDPGMAESYRRLLLATNDETFRLGHVIRIDPTPAWSGNGTHEGVFARLWVGQHRQLRLVVANLTGAPSQAFVPMSLPDFAGKEIRLEDLIADDVAYERSGDDLLVRGLYVDLPAWGGHIFKITRSQPTGRRKR